MDRSTFHIFPTYSQQKYIYMNQKDGFTALLLSIFLGYLGIDRFYLGKPITGTLKLLTGGLGGAWWLYDVIMIGTDSMTDGRGVPLKW